MTAGSLFVRSLPSTAAVGATRVSSGFFHVPWRAIGDETGVLSSSMGTLLSAGVAVSRNGWIGAEVVGLCGKCVGTMVLDAAAAGLEEGEVVEGGETALEVVLSAAAAAAVVVAIIVMKRGKLPT